MHPVEEVSMIVTRLGDITWHPYAAPSYLEKHGTPTTPANFLNIYACHTRAYRLTGPGDFA